MQTFECLLHAKINKTWFLPLRVVETEVQETSHNAVGWAPLRRKEASAVGSAWGSSRGCHRGESLGDQLTCVIEEQMDCKWWEQRKGNITIQTQEHLWLTGRKQRTCRSHWDDWSLFLKIPIQQNFLRWRKCFVCIVATSHTQLLNTQNMASAGGWFNFHVILINVNLKHFKWIISFHSHNNYMQ